MLPLDKCFVEQAIRTFCNRPIDLRHFVPLTNRVIAEYSAHPLPRDRHTRQPAAVLISPVSLQARKTGADFAGAIWHSLAQSP